MEQNPDPIGRPLFQGLGDDERRWRWADLALYLVAAIAIGAVLFEALNGAHEADMVAAVARACGGGR